MLSGLGGLRYCNDHFSIHDGLLQVHAEYKHCHTAIGCVRDVHTKYRDIQFILPFFIQLLMFTTPVIYPPSIVPEQYQWLLTLNPMTGLIDAHRACLLGYQPVDFARVES
jgi:hypothetical protein